MRITIEPYEPDPQYDSDLSLGRWRWSVRHGSTYGGVEATELDAWREANTTVGRVSPLLPFYGVSNYHKMESRAEAAEQRAEAAEVALAQARADRTLMAGLWLVTVPPRDLPALLPTDQADRDRLAAALDAVDRQPGTEARIAAGRAVIARIVAETGGGAR